MTYAELLRVPNIRWLAVSRFFTSLIFYSTVIVAFESSRGLNYTGIFSMESILSLAIFVFEMPTGVWADRFGHRRLITAGYAIQFAGIALYAVSFGFWMFAVSAFLSGLGMACLSGCESALLYESLPEGRQAEAAPAGFALLSAAGSAGFFFGLAAGSFIGARDPAWAVYATVIPCGLAWLAAGALRPDSRSRSDADEPGQTTARLVAQATALIRRDPGTACLALLGSAAFAMVNAMFWYNQPFMEREGIPVALFGPVTAVAVGARMLLALAAPRAEAGLGRRTAVLLACLAPGVAYLAAANAEGPVAAAALVAAVLALGAWRAPLLEAEINGRIPDGARATTLSALSFLGTLAGMGLNLLIGAAGDVGLATALRSLGIGLIAIAVLPLLLIRQKV